MSDAEENAIKSYLHTLGLNVFRKEQAKQFDMIVLSSFETTYYLTFGLCCTSYSVN